MTAVAVCTSIAALLTSGRFARGQQLPQTASIVVGVEDHARVIRYDVTSHQRTDVYRSDHYLDDLTLSPDGRHIAVREQTGSGPAARDRLVIVESTGRPVRTIDDEGVGKYAWCCRPNEVGIIAAERGEGGIEFRPKRLYVVDILAGAERHIEGVGLPYQIAWSPFDSALYVKSFADVGSSHVRKVVYRYHSPTGAVSSTPHHGVFFSPDGKFYFDKSEEGREWQLYRTADDGDVTARLALSPEMRRLSPEGGWLPTAGHVLVFVEKRLPAGWPDSTHRTRGVPPRPRPTPGPHLYPDRWNVAVDAETGQVISRFQGDIGAGWKTNAPALPVERGGGIEFFQLRP